MTVYVLYTDWGNGTRTEPLAVVSRKELAEAWERQNENNYFVQCTIDDPKELRKLNLLLTLRYLKKADSLANNPNGLLNAKQGFDQP